MAFTRQYTVSVPFYEGEHEIMQAIGNAAKITGGILIVTNYRLIFEPWDLKPMAILMKWGCKAIQMPHASAINFVVGRIVSIVDSQAAGVGGIVDVWGEGQASITSAPYICVKKDDGTTARFGVLEAVSRPSFWPGNNAARDGLVDVARRTFL
jgi:hypothetical protein